MFVITIPATLLLLVHMQPVGHLAGVVRETTLASGELAGLRIQLLADAGAAVVVLLIATTLSIYKPRGLTPYGWRKQLAASDLAAAPLKARANWGRYVLIALVALVLLVVVIHLAGGGLHGH